MKRASTRKIRNGNAGRPSQLRFSLFDFRFLSAFMAVLLAAMAGGCGSSKTMVTVTVVPGRATVVLAGSQQFSARVNGSSNQAVSWGISGTNCSSSTNNCGTITTGGLYTAPTTLPNPGSTSPNTVTVTATSQATSTVSGTATVTLDSGIRVTLSPLTATIGTGENIAVTPTVSGTNIAANLNVTWSVNGTANGNTTVGQICVSMPPTCNLPPSTGTASGVPVFYLAPTTAPTGVVTITATSTVDTTRSGNASITVVTAADPVLSANGLSPNTAAQGSVFQDVYLTGKNFLSTSAVLANGSVVQSTFLSQTLLRVRIPSCPTGNLVILGCPGNLLQNAGSISIVVQRQNGDLSAPQSLAVIPQRPALVSLAPNSLPQCTTPSCPSVSVLLTGGYYSPSTTATFNGQPVTFTQQNATNPTTQATVTIPGSAQGTAGLFPLVLQNAGVSAVSAVNLAVEPSAAVNPPVCFQNTSLSTTLCETAKVGTAPSAVAINKLTAKAVIVNSGDNTISVADLSNCNSISCPVTTISLPAAATGTSAVSVAVDDLHNQALVLNSGNSTASTPIAPTVLVVDLSGVNATQTITLPGSCPVPSGTTPTPITAASIGVNPRTQHAVVANQPGGTSPSVNCATVIDLSQTPPLVGTDSFNILTGLHPAVAIDPRLDWGIITPGGTGVISIVDMNPAHQVTNAIVNAPSFITPGFVSLAATIQGIGLNTETDQALLTDPTTGVGHTFSELDQSINNFSEGFNNVAAAANPLTNVGIAVNNQLNSASLVDLRTATVLGSSIQVGTTPVAVAVDPASDEAVVVNQGDNTITVLSLGTIRSLQIVETSPAQVISTSSSATNVPVTLVGSGFVAGSLVRLDGQPLAASNINVVSGRQIVATVPSLQAPHRYVVDVLNPDGTVSNVTEVPVIQAVNVGTAPQAVAIDEQRNLAVVTNTGDNTISLVNLSSGTVVATINVGPSPQGVDVISRLGRAVVTNNSDGTVSLVDLVGQTVTGTATVGQGPLGVAINGDTTTAVVANSVSNNVTLLPADTGASPATINVDLAPVALAIDVTRNLATVACATQNTVDVVDLGARLIVGRPSGQNSSFQFPNGVALDPVSRVFLVANSLFNDVSLVDPTNLGAVSLINTGIDPTSIAYNFQTSTVLTANSFSHTVSVMDFLGRGIRAVLSLDNSPLQAIAIDSQTNLAVVVDQANNRILLVPPPR